MKNQPEFYLSGTHHGTWVQLEFVFGDHKTQLVPTFIGTDGLTNLLSATVQFISGLPRADANFFDEPGEWIVEFLGKDGPKFQLRVYHLNDFTCQALEDIRHRAELLFEAKIGLLRWCRQLLALFAQWEMEMGVEGYENGWKHKWPAKQLEKIRNWVYENGRDI